MEVTLKPNNRKATIISGINDDLVKVRVEDGRELVWPISKINMPPKEGEEMLKMVVIPALQVLWEFNNEAFKLEALGVKIKDDEHYLRVRKELEQNAENEYRKKWGLSGPKQKEPPTPNETGPMPI